MLPNMFHLCMYLFSALLFFVLTPGILLTVPPKSSKNAVALVHALVFAIVWHFTHKLVWYATENFESDERTYNQVATLSTMKPTVSNEKKLELMEALKQISFMEKSMVEMAAMEPPMPKL